MAVYRYQVVCVGMWRGKIKRWNTTFHNSNSGFTTSLYGHMQKVCYPNPGDVLGGASGGVASISVYNASGGAPISVTTYFDWQAPGTWIPYTGTLWTGAGVDTPIDASGESALLLVGKMAGLSSTGKPVTTRKYIHAIPSRSAADFSDPDITPADATALADEFGRQWLANPAGVQPSEVIAEPYYYNHQRVRGRRRTTKAVAAGAFSLGVLAGGGATTSGQGDQFPGGEF